MLVSLLTLLDDIPISTADPDDCPTAIVAILYSGVPSQAGGIISLPIVLYQGSQIVLGQITVAILKAWHKRVKASEAKVEEEKGERGVRVASEGKAGETKHGEGTEKRREEADSK